MYQKKTYPTNKSQTFTGKIAKGEKGNVIQYNYVALRQRYLDSLPVDQNITETITDKKPLRTLQHNNYLWLFYSLIGLSSGHTSKELHIWAKGKFLTKGITEVFGDKTRIVKSTKELNRSEFCEFICRIEDDTGIEAPETEPFLKPLTHNEYAKLKAEQQKVKQSKAKNPNYYKEYINKYNNTYYHQNKDRVRIVQKRYYYNKLSPEKQVIYKEKIQEKYPEWVDKICK